MAEKLETLGIKVPKATKDRLKALSELRDRSPHYLAVRALERYLDEEEEYERRKRIDMERWEEYQQTGEAIPNERALEWLGQLAQGKRVSWHE